MILFKRTCHAVEQTVAIGGDTNNAEMYSRVVVNESVPRGLDLRSRVGSFADSTIRRFAMGKRGYYWRLAARFMNDKRVYVSLLMPR